MQSQWSVQPEKGSGGNNESERSDKGGDVPKRGCLQAGKFTLNYFD